MSQDKNLTTDALVRRMLEKDPSAFLTISQVKKGRHFHQFGEKRFDVDTFYKELFYEEVSLIQKRLTYRIFRFNQNDYPCLSCEKPQDMVFSIQSTGVFARCVFCDVTFNAVIYDPEKEVYFAELVETKEVTLEEAKAICERTGQNTFFLKDLDFKKPQRARRHLDEK